MNKDHTNTNTNRDINRYIVEGKAEAGSRQIVASYFRREQRRE
jgi:hypothetical protein